jgi:K+-transporting ATPase ATPase C chain
MNSQLRPAIASFLMLTVITGVVYPAIVTGVARTCFANKATGSVIIRDGKPRGSELIGQPFSDPKYFWSRPSATSPVPYAGQAGSGSNLAQSNPALTDAVKQRTAALQAADFENHDPIPADLLTASASGLDPHISVAAAEYQASRVARFRHMHVDSVKLVINQFTENRTLSLLGEPRVNVLELNLALDARSADNH